MQQGGGCLPSNGWNNITTLEEGSNFDEEKLTFCGNCYSFRHFEEIDEILNKL